ncbi:MAG: hypothetical protein NXI09_03255 [Bacteroidetes bacterium]|nr:hypothetical protein [Bacteroidota bacterium]
MSKSTFYFLIIAFLSLSFCRAQQLRGVRLSAEGDQSGLPIYGVKGEGYRSHPEGLADQCLWHTGDTIYMFGGRTNVQGVALSNRVNNRLWRYSPNGNWELIGGDSISLGNSNPLDSFTVRYGTVGQASEGNQPGPRMGASYFTGIDGRFYMYGGYGLATDTIGTLGDLWSYSNGLWTFLAGDSIANPQAFHVNQGPSLAFAKPGARFQSACWMDDQEDIWLFAGSKYDYNSIDSNYQDLWKWDGLTWSWQGGDSLLNQGSEVLNQDTIWPASRHGAASTYFNGNLYLIGGFGSENRPDNDFLQNLWSWDGAAWTILSNCSGSSSPAPSANAFLTVINNQLTLIGISTANIFLAGIPGLKYNGSQAIYKYLGNGAWSEDFIGLSNGFQQRGPLGLYHPELSPFFSSSNMACVNTGSELYLYGGQLDQDYTQVQSDFYKYNGSNWAFLSGAGIQDSFQNASGPFAQPGERYLATGFFDKQNSKFYYFGGKGKDVNGRVGNLNDLWLYDRGAWKWLSGSQERNPRARYGIKYQSDSGSTPGGRQSAASWLDGNGDFWLMGGRGYDYDGNYGYLNDLWKFDGVFWTWMSGDSIVDQSGVYGLLNIADSANSPRARDGHHIWLKPNGDLILFGGQGLYNGSTRRFNDLWKWDGSTWTWIGGSSSGDPSSVYTGVNAIPGGRSYAAISAYDDGFYLFGGIGRNQANLYSYLDELWHFDGSEWELLDGRIGERYPKPLAAKASDNADSVQPGGVYGAHLWKLDSSLYLFGGRAHYADEGKSFASNTLWHWDGENWAFLKGDTTSVDSLHKTIGPNIDGEFSFNSLASGRYQGICWQELDGLHLIGGYGIGDDGALGPYLSDHWTLDQGNLWDGHSWSLGTSNSKAQNAQISGTISPGNLQAKDLFIDADCTMDFTGDSLRISGDLYLQHNILGRPLVEFNGLAYQEILGEDSLYVLGIVKLDSLATLKANERLCIGAQNDSIHGQLFNHGEIEGLVEFEYYLNLDSSANNGRYFHIGNVLDSVSILDFNQGGIMNTGNDNSGVNTVWQWDATNSNWFSPSNRLLAPGTGLAIYAGANASGNFIFNDNQSRRLVVRAKVPKLAPVQLNLDYHNGQGSGLSFNGGNSSQQTEGWNLISNPFPHDLDLEPILTQLNNSALYMWNGESYAAWAGVSINGGSSVLAPGQGFYIQLDDGQSSLSSLNISSSPAGMGASQRHKTESAKEGLLLSLKQGSRNLDQLWCGIDRKATAGFDGKLDAWQMNYNQAQFAAQLDSGQCTIAHYHPDSIDIIPLSLLARSYQGQDLEIVLERINLAASIEVFLVDRLRDQELKISAGMRYSFRHDSLWSQRFLLRFQKGGALEEKEESNFHQAFVYQEGSSCFLDLKAFNDRELNLRLFNSSGALVEEYLKVTARHRIEILRESPSACYFLHISDAQSSSSLIESMSLYKP